MEQTLIDVFIKNLLPEEIKTIRNYIKKKSNCNESAELLDCFENLLLGINTQIYLQSLKEKLFNFTLEAIQQLEHIQNNNLYNLKEQIVFKLKKQMLSVKLLQRQLK